MPSKAVCQGRGGCCALYANALSLISKSIFRKLYATHLRDRRFHRVIVIFNIKLCTCCRTLCTCRQLVELRTGCHACRLSKLRRTLQQQQIRAFHQQSHLIDVFALWLVEAIIRILLTRQIGYLTYNSLLGACGLIPAVPSKHSN